MEHEEGRVALVTASKVTAELAPVHILPFGMQFREQILAAGAGDETTTTATVSGTSGPDVDTDPPDSDA